ncbi:unnamed protein product [Rotaria sp. Silwood1]|nr:unnamed protein product [Rotaria sp. Silwood1]CAF3342844.1 unnamed protein product [Rotaria sp. Silwood1]CAF3370140.1 unnamed protein product [Rotaria sp. Silwood1]CAF3434720.1 unnamed protein product [Rotaria sp. Silwood1]CAF4584843.1 unnamed protein product [Rotaria sp. Silwood1]
MPSFKERFRPSRKYKKNKEAGVTGIDESINSAVASAISTNTSHAPRTGRGSLTTISNATTAMASAAVTAAAAAPTTTGKTIDEHTGSAAFSTYHSYYLIDQCK